MQSARLIPLVKDDPPSRRHCHLTITAICAFTAMRHFLINRLARKHIQRGPPIRCHCSMNEQPQSPPHDDGRLAICNPCESIDISHNTLL